MNKEVFDLEAMVEGFFSNTHCCGTHGGECEKGFSAQSHRDFRLLTDTTQKIKGM